MGVEHLTKCTVGDVAAPTRNALVGGPFGSDLVTRDYVSDGVPVIRGTNMGHGRWVGGDFVYVTRQKADSLAANCAKGGDLVFTQRGTLGQVALLPEDNTARYLISQSQMKLTVDSAKANALFLYYVFTSTEQQEYIRQNAIQTGVPHTNLGILRNTPLLLPSVGEQTAIAAVLGALDDKIELNQRMNATLETTVRALFQSWFVDFDPVRAKIDGRQPPVADAATASLFPGAFIDTPLGPLPHGWTPGTLGDVGLNPRRGVQPSEIAPQTPYIALDHMPRRCIALGEWAESADVSSGKFTFRKGEILFGKLRPYFHKVGVAPLDGVCSTDILVVTPKSPEWFGFLLAHLSSDALIQFTDLASTGTKMPRTNWADISTFKVVLPPRPLAGAFTSLVMPMVERIVSNLFQSRTLAALRDSLLPKLLSGELTAPDLSEVSFP